jgi:hypothetical protein
VDAGLRDGRLVVDDRLAKLLAQCPDPLAGGPSGSLRVEPSPVQLEQDRSALEFDAMFTLARTSRWLMVSRERHREQLARLRKQRDAATKREERHRRRTGRGFGAWSRLRRVLGRQRG